MLSGDVLLQSPHVRESKIYSLIRFFIDPTRRRTLSAAGIDDKDLIQFATWLEKRGNRRLRAWWKSTLGWRSPKTFQSFRERARQHGIPHLTPFEVAHMRLPDDIACDADVVSFQAWCQGVAFRTLQDENPLKESFREAFKAGMVKFCRSPWVSLASAAPFMAPTGVLFPKIGYFDSCTRMEYLLTHPYEATDGELRYILSSSMFRAGRENAGKARRSSRSALPPGHWFVGGSIQNALGPHFRRGLSGPAKQKETQNE